MLNKQSSMRSKSSRHNDYSLLIVDDEPRLCESLKFLLNVAGYDVDTALTGQEAISYLEKRVYHLAILDYELPDCNGNEIARLIAEKHSDTAVIMLTGRATVDTVIMAMHQGVYDYLQKPYEPEHLISIIKGAIQHKRLEKKLRISHERLRFAMNISQLGYWQWEKKSGLFDISDEIYSLLSVDSATFKPCETDILRLIIPDDKFRVLLFYKHMGTERDRDKIEFQVRRSDGKLIVIRAEYVNLYNNSGVIIGKYGVFQDITDFKQTESQLILSGEIIENAMEGIYTTNYKGIIQTANPATLKITGYPADELIGKNLRILKSDRHSTKFHKKILSSLLKAGSWQGEIWTRRKNGEVYPQWLSITSLKEKAASPNTFIAIFHDITEIKLREQQIKHQVYHDSLTRLPNRLLFFNHLKAALKKGRELNQRIAVLFIDLDNFKNINDSLSHTIGDMLLCQVAERIKKCIRDQDTVARHGGDEFAVLLTDIPDIQPALKMASRINSIFDQPFMIKGNECFISASIGITISPQDGDDENVLISNADLAMYQAKAEGKNTFTLFTNDLNTKIQRRLFLISRLRNAIKNNEITVYYQPKVDIKRQAVMGVEALARWNIDPGEMVSPEEFIPIAEETGLIVEIGLFVLATACNQVVEWQKQGIFLSVAVNLSQRQLYQKDFLDLVTNVLDDSGLPANLLEFEITESLLMGNEDVLIEALWKFKKLGIKLSIDDFGTGYSSLAYLKRLPFDVLKIDRSFVKGIPENNEDTSLTSTIISMAAIFDLEVVAEGIETVAQYLFMEEHGCQTIQGYLVSPPEPAEKLINLFMTSSAFVVQKEQQTVKYYLQTTHLRNPFQNNQNKL